MERRIWTSTAMSNVYANMFVLLVAPPGVGKSQAIAVARQLWMSTKNLKVAPDDVTKASLIDALAAAKTTRILSPIEMAEYHSLLVGADELGVLLPQHDLAFLNTLNVLYDNRDRYLETRRGRIDEPIDLINPQLNLLAGTQPDYLGTLLPPEAWGMGFMTRILMIYHGHKSKPDLFGLKQMVHQTDLAYDLRTVADLYGPMAWDPEAQKELETWYASDLAPIPTHSKLKHYLPRRILHTIKLAMISSVARSNALVIEKIDVQRARDWLIEAESLMPEIFKDMGGKSDGLILQDLHAYVWEVWIKSGKKPIHRGRIELYLSNKTPAYNIPNILKVAVGSGILMDRGLDQFDPGTVNDTGEGS